MLLVGTIAVHLNGSLIEREPTLWEKLRQKLGASVDLSTDKVRVELEATAIVDAVRKALVRLRVTNALSLVIDQTVIFQDVHGKTDDLPDLLIERGRSACRKRAHDIPLGEDSDHLPVRPCDDHGADFAVGEQLHGGGERGVWFD